MSTARGQAWCSAAHRRAGRSARGLCFGALGCLIFAAVYLAARANSTFSAPSSGCQLRGALGYRRRQSLFVPDSDNRRLVQSDWTSVGCTAGDEPESAVFEKGGFSLAPVIKQAIFVVGLYLFFFKSTAFINHAVSRRPWLEAPVYFALSAIMGILIQSGQMRSSVSQSLNAVAHWRSTRTSKHFLTKLIDPLSRCGQATLAFFALNMLVNAIPESFAWELPRQWEVLTYLLGKAAVADGVITAQEIEAAFRIRSVSVLHAIYTTCFSWYIIRLKKPPKGFDPNEPNEPNLASRYWAALKKRKGLAPPLDFSLSVVVVLLAARSWLDAVGVNARAVLAFGGIGGLAFGLAAQNLVKNLISGMLILATNPFIVGDYIDIGGVRGYVREDEEEDEEEDEDEDEEEDGSNVNAERGYVRSVGWNFTTVETREGSIVYVPNGSMLSSKTDNRTGGTRRLLEIEFPVQFPDGAFDHIDELIDGIQQTALELPELSGRILSREVRVLFQGVDTGDNPTPMMSVEVRLDNRGLQSIRYEKSALYIAVLKYLRSKGCIVPGLEGDGSSRASSPSVFGMAWRSSPVPRSQSGRMKSYPVLGIDI